MLTSLRYGNGMTVQQVSHSKDQFFENLQSRNASRVDGLAPSQGGKYGGFGNAAYSPPSADADILGGALSVFHALCKYVSVLNVLCNYMGVFTPCCVLVPSCGTPYSFFF